jgi:hypothetical protein
MKVLVCHAFHGCDTGCCGHVVIVEDDAGKVVERGDLFNTPGHPYERAGGKLTDETMRAFVIERVTGELGEDHVKDIDWERCVVIDDC